MKLTISGTPGSGKSSVAYKLCKQLDLTYYDLGKIRRKLASEKKITLEELNKLGEKEKWTDKEPDKFMEKIGKKENNFIFVGRLAYYFIPDSIKIYLKCDIKTGAKRIFNDNISRSVEKYNSIEEYIIKLKERTNNDIKRFEKYYNINPYDETKYDLVIDTTNLSIYEVINQILIFIIKEFCKINEKNKN